MAPGIIGVAVADHPVKLRIGAGMRLAKVANVLIRWS